MKSSWYDGINMIWWYHHDMMISSGYHDDDGIIISSYRFIRIIGHRRNAHKGGGQTSKIPTQGNAHKGGQTPRQCTAHFRALTSTPPLCAFVNVGGMLVTSTTKTRMDLSGLTGNKVGPWGRMGSAQWATGSNRGSNGDFLALPAVSWYPLLVGFHFFNKN